MSQRQVERLLGRLLSDTSFRQAFFEAPEDLVLRECYDVTPRELSSLLTLDEAEIASLGLRLGGLIRQPVPASTKRVA